MNAGARELPGRRLSSSERAVWLLDQVASLSGVFVARIEGGLDESALRRGLDHLQRRHPLLRVHVEEPEHPRYVDGPTVPIPLRVIPRLDDEQWRAMAEEELNAPLAPDASPLVRAVLLHGDTVSELLLTHHHVICDALSAVYQVRDLLEAATASVNSSDEKTLSLRPPLDELVPSSQRGLARFGAVQNFFWRQAATKVVQHPKKLRIDSFAEPPLRRTRIIPGQLDTEATAALAASCRRENTSVQGALVAALLLAARDDLDADATLGCFSGVNLRDRLTVSLDGEVGLFVSQSTTFHRLEEGCDRWELAREIRTALRASIERREPFVTLPMLGMFIPRGRDVASRFARRIDLAAPAAMGVTNIGALPIPDRYGPLALTDLRFAIGIALVAPLALTACTHQGALRWNLLHVDPLIAPARAHALADRLRHHLAP